MIALGTALLIALFLAYANGANDNLKGVATLLGSGTANYRTAMRWATLTTFLGSMFAWVLAHGLLAKFSGKGLVPGNVMEMKSFALAVGIGAAATVMLATRFGFPISTTHALLGALVGAGTLASAAGVNFSRLAESFVLPLILSPLLALSAAAIAYPFLRKTRSKLGVQRETCLCIGREVIGTVAAGTSPEQAVASFSSLTLPTVTTGTPAVCIERYQGHVLGISAASLVDVLHYISGGAVCFARGLNDTPKIAALLLAGSAISPQLGMAAVGVFMVAGGIFNGRRVVETMSFRVTTMNPGQGFAANLVTSFLVIGASRFGLPVSTTHVSCGSLFGIGLISGHARAKTIASILVAWVTTLPVAAILSGLAFLLFERLPGLIAFQ